VPTTANVGSLQWDTNYSAAGGGFDGAAGTVSCTSLVAGALAAFNDVEATTILTSGIITTTGFLIPADVSRCDFTTTGATAPTAGQFAISNVIATDPEGNDLDVNVIVSNIT
jgi:hypothetical protein